MFCLHLQLYNLILEVFRRLVHLCEIGCLQEDESLLMLLKSVLFEVSYY